MKKYLRLFLLVGWAMVPAGVYSEDATVPLLREDFSQYRRLSKLGSNIWEFHKGRLIFNGGRNESRLLTRLFESGECEARAQVVLQKRSGATWATAGLLLYSDPGNLWRLILVEGPSGRRYFELLERFQGVHQAQIQRPESGTALASKFEGKLQSWEYGRHYDLSLKIRPDSIRGDIVERESGKRWKKTFLFSPGKALKRGRPALGVAGFEGEFGPLAVDGKEPPMINLGGLRPGKAGTALVLESEKRNLAQALARLLAEAGFGTRILSWEELGPERIPLTRVDLLALPDARRLPDRIKGPLMDYAHGGGSLLLIGAPGFGEMLSKTPEGWTAEANYNDRLARTLKTQPLRFADGHWRHTARNSQRLPTVRPVDKSGAEFITVLDGWSTFARTVEKPIPEENAVLTFQARGDANTPQLSIECNEQDQSRWIASVDLTTKWKTFILRAADFPNWPDSPAKRGAFGDHLNFGNLSEVRFGLSSSHTPKCQPGRHVFAVRRIAWATFPFQSPPDFAPPALEGVSPSYKIYPLANIRSLAAAAEQFVVPAHWAASWSGQGFAPIWRPRGRGIDRQRSWRSIPIIETVDGQGQGRGALVSLMVGDHSSFGARWASIGLADPAEAFETPFRKIIAPLARALTGQSFLLEAGAKFFSYRTGESIELGATVLNPGSTSRKVAVVQSLHGPDGALLNTRREVLLVKPQETESWRRSLVPGPIPAEGLLVRTELIENGRTVDRIEHRIQRLSSGPYPASEYVRIRGSNFFLGGRPWYMNGINYRPNFIGGYGTLDVFQRASYDPEVIEKDLSTLESMGINFLSGVHALAPPRPEDPAAYRDLADFLDRCRRHGMKVFYFLPWGNPFLHADVDRIKTHIRLAGLEDHPAILAWELAWEPIYSFGKRKHLPELEGDWTQWVEQRYGSIENAERDWEFELSRGKRHLRIPGPKLCATQGKWDRAVAAFRRFYSDYVSQLYLPIVRDLRAFDRQHLITFRGGACGIPSGPRFAHLHSVGVAKHIDFLCPEGYNLQNWKWQGPMPPDEIRKGGLITLYYRYISREKPVVWMEFGYTVNGIHVKWRTGMEHVTEANLSAQRKEYQSFYSMFLESGSRGAAPWWLPGGFRLGENSDFGVLNADGTERPACKVIRDSIPRFAQVRHTAPDAWIDLDLDAHHADAWTTYSHEYLSLVKSGKRPYLRTRGTGTNSADTPLLAVGDGPCNGHNPPKFLNAEFNTLEISTRPGAWDQVEDGDTLEAPAGATIRCRASVGNIGEARWLAPGAGPNTGKVFLAGRPEYGLEFKAPITADTEFLHDVRVKPFILIPAIQKNTNLSIEMLSKGRTHFGERRRITVLVENRPEQ